MGRGTRTWLPAAVAVACLGTAGEALALRCQSRLIAEGDAEIEVRKYCGEPTSVRQRYAQRALVDISGRIFYPGFSEEVLIEEWTYNFGPHRLMRTIRLENGIVTEIRHLGYGFQE